VYTAALWLSSDAHGLLLLLPVLLPPPPSAAAAAAAAAALSLLHRAVRGGFVPSPDAHLETAAQFGGPGASAVGDMVQAVYSACVGDGRTVERSVEHLTQGMAGDTCKQ
jgi:hypothetical protein